MAISNLNADDLKRAGLSDGLTRVLATMNTNTQDLVANKLDTSGKDAANGYAALDGAGKISAAVLPGLTVLASGVASLVTGTVTVSSADTPATGNIMLTADGTLNAGVVAVTARIVGVSFTIGSLNPLDARSVAWMIVG